MSLKLEVAAAFLPQQYLYVLHPFSAPTHIDNLDRASDGIPPNCCYVISGSVNFIRRILGYSQVKAEWSIVHAEFPFRDFSGPRARSTHRYNLQQQLVGLGLDVSILSHYEHGGGTDAKYVVGVGLRLDDDKILRHQRPPELRRSIRHFWEDAASGITMSPCDPPPPLDGPSPLYRAHYVKHIVDDAVAARVEGLFPVANSHTLCVGKSVFHPKKCVLRRLSNREMLRLWDIPMILDHLLESKTFNLIRGPAPYEASMTPNVWAYVFRTLWAGDKGGVSSGNNTAPAAPTGHSGSGSPAPAASAADIPTSAAPSTPPPTNQQSPPTGPSTAPSVPSRTIAVSNDEFDLQSHVSFDDYSDNDSLMPRKRRTRSDESTATTDGLSICSGSTASFASAGSASTSPWEVPLHVQRNDDESSCNVSICSDTGPYALDQLEDETGDLSLGDLAPSNSGDSNSNANSIDEEGSLASQDTLLANTTPTITTPSQELMNQVRDTTIGKKAVRSDDAEVPVSLWDIRISTESPVEDRSKVFTVLRKFWRRIFQRYLYQDCVAVIRKEFGQDWYADPTLKRVDKGQYTKLGYLISGATNALFYTDNTNFFEYLSGSKTFYFRFPVFHQKMIRDGATLYFEKPGPKLSPWKLERAQPNFPDPGVKEEVRKKVLKVKRRRYIVGTTRLDVASIIKYFAVPKGEEDWRVVYDATASGLNECVWAPSFWLPTVDSLVRALNEDSWMADRDIGDMFLNFELHHKAWNYVGVDLAPVMDDTEKRDLQRWHHWVRLLMGFRPSPYCAIKSNLVAEEVIRGDRRDPHNAFHWDHIELNLPGPDYVPTKSWVMKVRIDSTLASDLFTFVDDERLTGRSEEATWQAGHVVGSKQAYMGVQDAARKVGECSQQPRAWAGAVVHVIPNLGVCVLTSEEKWKRLKEIIAKWTERILAGNEELDHKELLSDRGFLVYVTRAYPGMVPYLKGFHLTIEMWRGNRDAEGWKLPSKQLQALVTADNHLGPIDDEEAEMSYLMQTKVKPTLRAPSNGSTPIVPRLLDDLKALHSLTRSSLPPLRVVRPTKIVQVLYGFGDASGTGFGSTVQGFPTHSLSAPSGQLNYRVGVWGSDEESESSNYRELSNLVLTVEEEAASGSLDLAEFFLFTDNSTAESAFYKGSSSSKKLHELVLRLRRLELRHGLTLHVIHVSGKRMIAQGTDGCSRGVLLEGVMIGDDMLSFVDLGRSAVERSSTLLAWIRSWCLRPNIMPLSPDDWFETGHGISGGGKDKRGIWIPTHEPPGNCHLWTPPPAAADAALEQLLQARHKRTDTSHIVVIPRLLAPHWRRLFHKAVDVSFSVPPGTSFWPTNMFEPLWVGIVFPYHRFSPWQLSRAPLMVDMGRKLHKVCSASEADAGHLLRKLCKLPRRLASLQEHVARGVLRMPRQECVSDGETDR